MRIAKLALVLAVSLAPFSACGGGGSGDSSSQPPDVLLLHVAEATFAIDVAGKLTALGVFGTVQGFDALNASPDLATLQMYDAVLVMSDDEFDDSTAVGDALADYVDGGGGVVLTMFSMSNFGTGRPEGRFATGNYLVIGPSIGSSLGTTGSMVVVDGAHPILSGVTTFGGASSSYAPVGSTLVGGSTLVATWDDVAETPLIATRTIGGKRRADLGFYPPTQDTGRADFIDPSTDTIRIVANALLWVTNRL